MTKIQIFFLITFSLVLVILTNPFWLPFVGAPYTGSIFLTHSCPKNYHHNFNWGSGKEILSFCHRDTRRCMPNQEWNEVDDIVLGKYAGGGWDPPCNCGKAWKKISDNNWACPN